MDRKCPSTKHEAPILEERARLLARLEALDAEPGCGPAAVWINDGGFDAA